MITEIPTQIFCPLGCQANPVVFTVKNTYPIYKCLACKLLFVRPLPVASTDIYSADYFQGAHQGFGYTDYDQDKEAMRSTFVKYLEYIEKNKQLPGRLLDVGAATGFFLSIAKHRGWEVAGIELSDFAAEIGRKKGIDIRTGTLGDTDFAPHSFDVITLWDVIEHMSDPATELAEVWKLLKPGGIVAINTPDANSLLARALGKQWHALVPPEHLYYFSAKNLGDLLKAKNFMVLGNTTFCKKFTVSYIYKTLIHWKPWFAWSWLERFLDKPAIKWLALPLYLGDNFFIVAKKPE